MCDIGGTNTDHSEGYQLMMVNTTYQIRINRKSFSFLCKNLSIDQETADVLLEYILKVKYNKDLEILTEINKFNSRMNRIRNTYGIDKWWRMAREDFYQYYHTNTVIMCQKFLATRNYMFDLTECERIIDTVHYYPDDKTKITDKKK